MNRKKTYLSSAYSPPRSCSTCVAEGSEEKGHCDGNQRREDGEEKRRGLGRGKRVGGRERKKKTLEERSREGLGYDEALKLTSS